jgi:hypothetical protein
MGMPSQFTVKVVGVSFVAGYPKNVFALDELAGRRFISSDDSNPESIAALLVRNPNNEHDPNAIEVHVPDIGSNPMIGHIPASVASRLAPLLDAGESWSASIKTVAIDPNHPQNPGIILSVAKTIESDPF